MSFHVRRIRETKPPRTWPWKRVALVALTFARPLLGLYQTWRTHEIEEQKQHARVAILKKILLILIAACVTLILFVGIARGLVWIRVLNMETVVTVAGTPPPKDANGFVNILLLGQGDAGHDGKDLTDTMMVASIDPENTKSVVLLSLPRDLYLLSTEKMGEGRINSMYRDYKSFLQFREGKTEKEASQEAMKQLALEVGKIMNLDLSHVVKVDFIGFVKVVDALGGIDIDVPENLLDTEYPDNNYGYTTFAIQKGLQHLDGETALKYARSRHSSSDFDRSARQQMILSALGEKAKNSGLAGDPSAIMDIWNILSENVETTLGTRELIGLAAIGGEIDRSKILTMQLSDRNALYGGFVEPGGFLYTPPRDLFGGAAVLLPVSIPETPVTWKQLQTLSSLLFVRRDIYLQKPQIAIRNGGAASGLGRKLATELVRYGLNVPVIENATIEGKLPTSIIIPRSEADRPLAEFIASVLKISVGPAPVGFPQEELGQITILLGQDYRYVPFQDLLPSGS